MTPAAYRSYEQAFTTAVGKKSATVGAHQFGLGEDVVLHGLQHLEVGRARN